MKYLKMFDTYHTLGSELYQRIDMYVYGDYVSNISKHVRFDDNEKTQLTKIGFKIKWDNRWYYATNFSLGNYRSHSNITIKKDDDNWYYLYAVNYDRTKFRYEDMYLYFRCDQFDGLLECLKNEFNIS